MTIPPRGDAVEAVWEGPQGVQAGDRAPDFLVKTPVGTLPLSELARRVRILALVSQDSYQFHPG